MAVSRSAMMVPGVYVCISDDASRSAMVVPGVYVTALGVAAGGAPTVYTALEDIIPAAPVNADSAVSLSTEVASSLDGYVTGGRFYKGDASGGDTHTVALYDAGGTLLASKVTTGLETASGWQEFLYDTPVAVVASTTYWAVTHWPGGGYPFTNDFFSGGPYTVNAPLAANTGYYKYGASLAFPDTITSQDNFYSDILFQTELGGGDTEDDLLANNVGSASAVTQPAVRQLHGLLANDVGSASSVSHPAAVIGRGLLANDVTSASGVTSPAVHQRQALDAANVASESYVTSPAFSEIAPGVDGLLAEDLVSGSYVSTPALVEGGEVIPIPPEVGGGGGKVYGRGFPRKRWEELLALLEAERRAAQERAEAFEGKKDRQRAKKAAGEALRAVARAQEAADEAAQLAHLGDIARMLEAAAGAERLSQYLTLMREVRQAAAEMADEDEVETLLMLT